MEFTMELVWHNCLTYKPSEKYNLGGSELFEKSKTCNQL